VQVTGPLMASAPLACTVTSLVNQPLVPVVPLRDSDADGPLWSILRGTEADADPPALCATHEDVVPAVSAVKVCVPQPESTTTLDWSCVALQVTGRFDVSQPLAPAVPVTWGVRTGGVVSSAATVT